VFTDWFEKGDGFSGLVLMHEIKSAGCGDCVELQKSVRRIVRVKFVKICFRRSQNRR
jgi:hypothetical protein